MNAGNWAKWGQLCRFIHPAPPNGTGPLCGRGVRRRRAARQAKRTSVKRLGNFLSRKRIASLDTYLSPRQQIACCSVTTRPANSCSAPFSIYISIAMSISITNLIASCNERKNHETLGQILLAAQQMQSKKNNKYNIICFCFFLCLLKINPVAAATAATTAHGHA